MTLAFVDRSRPTVSRGQTVSGQRALTTLVWYPKSSGRWPVVVFAHGFQVGPAPYEHLCRAWAAAGYAVAAPEFPLTDAAVAGPALDENDLANQPADVAFVVSSLLAPGSPLALHLDGSRVAVAGHSDGAVTALGVAADRAIPLRAVIAVSGSPVAGTEPNPPLLVAQGDEDTVNPPATGRSVYEQAHRPRFLLSLLGGGHMAAFLGGTRWQAVVDKMTVDFLDRYLSGRTSSVTALLRDADPGASTLVADP
jgi:dienelactone hydrolase